MYIKIHLHPDSKEDSVTKISEEIYEVRVRAPAERGLANSSMLEQLSEIFPHKRIRIVSGHLSPHKIVSVN